MINGDDTFTIKIATGFYDNPKLGLPSGNGLMLVFSSKTGKLHAILQDQGYLTEIRTAIAGLIAAKYLGPKTIISIGILGTGMQARLQLQFLKHIISCKNVMVWGRTQDKLAAYKKEMETEGFTIQTTLDAKDVASSCNLIVTTTPATQPILMADWIQPGTHITAVGCDSKDKQELDAALFAKADICAVDAKSQCAQYGDAHHAIAAAFITELDLVELGQIIANPSLGRTHDEQITIADLTGVAIQDIQIAKSVLDAIR
jgi:ornithine cyclodeaminase